MAKGDSWSEPWVVEQSGSGDYTTLSSCLSNANTGANDFIEIQGTWTARDTTNATVADDNLSIRADSDSKHSGYVEHEATGTGHYRLYSSGSHALTVDNAGFYLEGIVINLDSSTISAEGVRQAENTSEYMDCIFYASQSTDQQSAWYCTDANSQHVFTNCIAYGFGRDGFSHQGNNTSDVLDVNSCTFWGNASYNAGTYGGGMLMRRGNCNCYNVISVGNVYHEDYGNRASTNYAISYCISSDTSISAEDSGGVGNQESRTAYDSDQGSGSFVIFNDITTAPYDLRLTDLDNAKNNAQAEHSTLTAEGLTLPTYDIAGNERSRATNEVDIGAFAVTIIGGTVNLVIQDGAHAVTSDNVALVQQNTLAIQDGAHAVISDNLDLVQQHLLAIADALHAHGADNLDLVQQFTLAIAAGIHAHSAQNVDLVQQHILAIDAGNHAVISDNVDLVQQHLLAIADALHAHAADNVVLDFGVSLVIQDGAHAQTADNVDLVQQFTLSIQAGAHTVTSDNVDLVQQHILAIADALHAHAADNVVLTVGGVTLDIQAGNHAHIADNVDLIQQYTLAIADALHAHAADNLDLSLDGVSLVIANSSHLHAADNLDLVQQHILAIDAGAHAVSSDNVDLIQQHILIVDDALHAHIADNVALVEGLIIPNIAGVYVIEAANRTLIIAPSSRRLVVDASDRTLDIKQIH